MKTLWTRSKTALLFITVMITGIYFSIYSYAALMLGMLILSFFEFFKLYQTHWAANANSKLYPIIASALGILGFFFTFPFSPSYFFHIGFAILLLSPFVLMALQMWSHSSKGIQDIGLLFLALLYIALPVWMLNTVLVNEEQQYLPLIPLGIILLIWTNDAFAYLTGSLFGKTKLFPRISPGKTWEGLIGGVIFNFLVAYLQSRLFGIFSFGEWSVIAAIVSIMATLGDLTESLMKRNMEVKDSGSIFPGHGGMLDRFDAFYFAVPFVVTYIWWLRH